MQSARVLQRVTASQYGDDGYIGKAVSPEQCKVNVKFLKAHAK